MAKRIPMASIDAAWLGMEDPTNLMMVTGVLALAGPSRSQAPPAASRPPPQTVPSLPSEGGSPALAGQPAALAGRRTVRDRQPCQPRRAACAGWRCRAL